MVENKHKEDNNPIPVSINSSNSVKNENVQNSQLKLLMEGKYIEPKKPEIHTVVLKKKFKVKRDDLPSL